MDLERCGSRSGPSWQLYQNNLQGPLAKVLLRDYLYAHGAQYCHWQAEEPDTDSENGITSVAPIYSWIENLCSLIAHQDCVWCVGSSCQKSPPPCSARGYTSNSMHCEMAQQCAKPEDRKLCDHHRNSCHMLIVISKTLETREIHQTGQSPGSSA